MARPRMDDDEKKVRVNVTINKGSREVAKTFGMNLSRLLENAIVSEYNDLMNDKHNVKISYPNKKWKSILEQKNNN